MAIRRDRRTSIPGARQECVKAGVGARTRARNRDRCPNPAGPAPRTTPDATQAGGPASGAFQSAMESVPRIIAATSRRHGRCSNARYASTPMSTAGTLSPGRATWTGTVPRRGGDHPRVEHARRQSRRSTRSHVRRGEAGPESRTRRTEHDAGGSRGCSDCIPSNCASRKCRDGCFAVR